ncbi:hypothetical protein QYE76_027512 [Lolium multiflorum]|uniref:Protein FAR1-RELATED SEQUENCE n=1 Tax=Lolium multiflorum TaxID=4521 RepID=A0AAD8QMI6_LOLMU|nr:hypothetical protein QYE76_027512 [Lolium multiflorum]
MVHLQVDSLVTSEVASTPPPVEASCCGDKVIESSALAPNSDALFARDLGDLLARLEAASPGSSKEIARLLEDKSSRGKIQKMSGLNLNATPTEDVEMDDAEKLFCTQVVPEPVVGESQDPDCDVHEAVVANSDRYSGRGHEHNGEQAATVGNQSFPTTTFPTDTTTNPDFAEGGSDGEAVGITEEILSSPQEPFLGMRFDTLADARAHYNAYAAKLGFSIKNNTSKKKAHTNELEKQQFVCNKYRPPKTEEQMEQEKMAFTEDVSPVVLDDDNDEEQEAGPSKKRKTANKFGVKRKRETIKQTKCRARMFVKLINNKWESTQRSEGFNAVLKRCINPKNSIKHFVRQYEKIQAKILGKEGNNDYRTDELEVQPRTTFPIEKHAMAVYTRDIFHRFMLEFGFIGRYDVQVIGTNMYELIPNNLRCYPYGSRNYYVNGSGGAYNCDCCKYQRDGILCCHVLKVFTHVGINAIPERFIMRRWTQQAVEYVPMHTGPVQDDVMPEQSRQKVRFANLSTSFVQMAKLGSESDQAEAIARRHIKEMRAEFVQLQKVRKKKNAQQPSTSAPHPNAAPNAPQQTAAPKAPQQTATPSMRRQRAAPNAPQQTAAPNAPQQTTTPSMRRQRTAPNAPQQTEDPNVTQQTATPSMHQQRAAPSALQQTASASMTQRKLVPNLPQQRAVRTVHCPSTSAPNVCQSGNAGAFQKGQQPAPSTWASHTANIDDTHGWTSSGSAHFSAQQPASSTQNQSTSMKSDHAVPQRPLRAKKSSSTNQTLSVQQASDLSEPSREGMVVLNPPRSNTKGRKKGRIPSGIELVAKKTTLCGTCGLPGHNAATCKAGLGHNKEN